MKTLLKFAGAFSIGWVLGGLFAIGLAMFQIARDMDRV